LCLDTKLCHEGTTKLLAHTSFEIKVDVDCASHLALVQDLNRFLLYLTASDLREEKDSFANQIMLLDCFLIEHGKFHLLLCTYLKLEDLTFPIGHLSTFAMGSGALGL